MTDIDSQVRNKFVEYVTEEAYELVSQPECRDKLLEIFKSSIESMICKVGEYEGSGEEEIKEDLEELRSEFDTELVPKINELFDNPFALKAQLYEQILEFYTSEDQLEVKIQDTLNQFSEGGLNEEIINEIKDSLSNIYSFARLNDRFISELVKVAEEQTIEKAVEKESIYSATRAIFPKEQDYRDHIDLGNKASYEIIQSMKTSLEKDEELGEEIGLIFDYLTEAVKKSIEFIAAFSKEYDEQRIKEIYGE